nr:hypothetical protein L204_05452 [Cryptococcus depauperatus CBS 7855]
MSDPTIQTWKDKIKAKGAFRGKIEVDKGVKFSDNIGGTVNAILTRKLGQRHSRPSLTILLTEWTNVQGF